MTQAGLHKITLYENNDLSINYDLFTIVTTGQIIELSTNPVLNIEPQAVSINYKITAQLDDLIQPLVNNINDSVYGWIAKFEFLDKTTKIIELPFFREINTELNTNTSHSRNINLESWNRRGLITFN